MSTDPDKKYYSTDKVVDPTQPPPALNLTPEAREHAKDWVLMLESGTLPQTRHCLRVAEANDRDAREPVGFCCLGVACHVMNPTLWMDPDYEGKVAYQSSGNESDGFEESWLPREVAVWLGLDKEEQDPLLRGAVRFPATIHYAVDHLQPYHKRPSLDVKVGDLVTMPASWWNDVQEFNFRDIAQMVRARFGIDEERE